MPTTEEPRQRRASALKDTPMRAAVLPRRKRRPNATPSPTMRTLIDRMAALPTAFARGTWVVLGEFTNVAAGPNYRKRMEALYPRGYQFKVRYLTDARESVLYAKKV